ncbi:hypothetical protein [Helicobacter pametensis]|uniref:hypothetical protein n=1 Tax=Helicobacter pametensis TaxID=95149 RepID=UPI0004875EB8|nr:hypothetical protein [Helicobacter pametensis]
MEMVYPYALIVHLFCAIFFVGFLFAEIVFITPILNRIPQEWSAQIKGILGTMETRVMPPCLLLLILSGGMMISQHLGGGNGYFDTMGQTLLTIKMILGLSIFALAAFSLSMFFIFKRPNPIGKYVHPIVFCLSLIIVLLAKLAFIVG